MAFVNEFVTDEKVIQENDLDNIWNSCDLGAWRYKMPEYRELRSHYWTIDREHNIWLMHVGVVRTMDSRSGLPEPTGERVLSFIFKMRIMNFV